MTKCDREVEGVNFTLKLRDVIHGRPLCEDILLIVASVKWLFIITIHSAPCGDNV